MDQGTPTKLGYPSYPLLRFRDVSMSSLNKIEVIIDKLRTRFNPVSRVCATAMTTSSRSNPNFRSVEDRN